MLHRDERKREGKREKERDFVRERATEREKMLRKESEEGPNKEKERKKGLRDDDGVYVFFPPTVTLNQTFPGDSMVKNRIYKIRTGQKNK